MTALLVALLLEAGASTGPGGLEALLRQLRQPVPAETVFVEQRSSDLLDQPLLLRGRLLRPDAQTLVREVQLPWRERTSISESTVHIVREGSRDRRFALRNAPGLEALLASFHGLLSGERALLERHYEVGLERRDDGWELTLLPRSQRLARRIASVQLHGRDGELRCMEIIETDGDRSRMLLAGAAEAEPPGFDAECGQAR